jgi:o-succinylbenzoate synthase
VISKISAPVPLSSIMQIDAIELFHIGLPLRKALPSPLGPREKLETVIVAMHSGGDVGWGEASPGSAPLAGAEWAAGAFALLRDWLAPLVTGQSVSSGDDLTKLLEKFRGNQFAKAALDTAWWDLDARLQNRPLYERLGGTQPSVEVGPTFDRMESIDDFLALIAAAVDAGFGRVKLKFRPGWDVRMVDFVRKECPTATVHVDCEGGLGLGHTDMLYRLEDFMLAMIEQPLPADDLVGSAMIQESLRTPICLDEAITSLAQAEMAMELKSCKFVNLKPGRVGGLTSAVAIHDLCHEHCTPCYVGAMPQSAIAGRIGFALATKSNCTYPADFFPSDQILAADIAEPLLPVKDSDGKQRVHLTSATGIGVEPDAALLEKFCIAKAQL